MGDGGFDWFMQVFLVGRLFQESRRDRDLSVRGNKKPAAFFFLKLWSR